MHTHTHTPHSIGEFITLSRCFCTLVFQGINEKKKRVKVKECVFGRHIWTSWWVLRPQVMQWHRGTYYPGSENRTHGIVHLHFTHSFHLSLAVEIENNRQPFLMYRYFIYFVEKNKRMKQKRGNGNSTNAKLRAKLSKQFFFWFSIKYHLLLVAVLVEVVAFVFIFLFFFSLAYFVSVSVRCILFCVNRYI